MTSCPIAGYSVDENASRMVALGVVGAVIAVVALPGVWAQWVLFALTCDFASRGFYRGRGSLLALAARAIQNRARIRPSKVDAGPKRFAARIGFGFSLALLGLGAWGGADAFRVVAVALGACAALEGLLGWCAGCRIWSAWWSLRARAMA